MFANIKALKDNAVTETKLYFTSLIRVFSTVSSSGVTSLMYSSNKQTIIKLLEDEM